MNLTFQGAFILKPRDATITTVENGKLAFEVAEFTVQVETSNFTQQADVLNFFLNAGLTSSRMVVIPQSSKPWVCVNVQLGTQDDGMKIRTVINELKSKTKHQVRIIL